MTSYKELLAQRKTLEDQIEAARKQELSEAVRKVRALVEEFSLTSEDIFSKKSATKATRHVAPKYRNQATGETWTGRGKAPKWIADKEREQFLIKSA